MDKMLNPVRDATSHKKQKEKSLILSGFFYFE